jgi:plasmanylethanolamine desaturase
LLLQFVLVVLFADFMSGLFHWLEDTYWLPTTPLLGMIVEANERHHRNPKEMLQWPWWQTIMVTFLLISPLFVVLTVLCGFSWQLTLLYFLLLPINEIHKWAHVPAGKQKNPLAQLVQKIGVLNHPHHKQHHRTLQSHYCILTVFLNPLLESINLWRTLEDLVHRTTGLRPRNGRWAPTTPPQLSSPKAASRLQQSYSETELQYFDTIHQKLDQFFSHPVTSNSCSQPN